MTAFFRDPEAFDALAQRVIPSVFEGKGAGDQVRLLGGGMRQRRGGLFPGHAPVRADGALNRHRRGCRSSPRTSTRRAWRLPVGAVTRRASETTCLGRSPGAVLHARGRRLSGAQGTAGRWSCSRSTTCFTTRRSRIWTSISCRNLLIYLDSRVQGKADQPLPLRAAGRRVPFPRGRRERSPAGRICSSRSSGSSGSTSAGIWPLRAPVEFPLTWAPRGRRARSPAHVGSRQPRDEPAAQPGARDPRRVHAGRHGGSRRWGRRLPLRTDGQVPGAVRRCAEPQRAQPGTEEPAHRTPPRPACTRPRRRDRRWCRAASR